MNAELFIAKRIYRGDIKDDKHVSSPAIKIAIAGIALGLAVMIAAICIVIGFKKEVRGKVVGFGSHIQITAFNGNSSYEYSPLVFSDTLAELLNNNSGISHIQEFIIKSGIIKTDGDFMGVLLKGVGESHNWDFFKTNLLEGRVINPDDENSGNQTVISKTIADKLQLKVGDKFTCYFIQEPVRARRFDIVGIYETNFEDYDKLFILTDKDVLRKLNDWEADLVSGIELILHDFNRIESATEELLFDLADYEDRLDNALYIRSIKDINPMIFNWLNLLDLNVWVIIILMVVVSGFTMISGLLIIMLERTNMIGMLKSMGARDFTVRKVFIYLSAFLIGRGMLWGNIIGLLFCIVQAKFQIIKLDPVSYYLSAVPIDLNPLYIILLNLGTLTISLLMMIGPSYLVAKITPAKSIRFE